ncbi:RHS repeat-associated core domain-containing protein [Micromonospora marina]|uniref:RHS repeat-associated core domain-containing protein n=1 Tax=Micromonospora marina TaxID=307120 RepID=UPI003D73B74C
MRANGVRYYYLVDGLGSVVGVVNGSATKVNSYSYDPYGIQLSASQRVSNPWRYAAGQFDGATGLTKFGARYYDGGLGRFTQRDPSGKDFPYTYAGGDPVKNVVRRRRPARSRCRMGGWEGGWNFRQQGLVQKRRDGRALVSRSSRIATHALVAATLAGAGYLVGLAFQRLLGSSDSSVWILAVIPPAVYLMSRGRQERSREMPNRLFAGLFAMVAGAVAFFLVLERSVFVAVIALVLSLAGMVMAVVAARHGRRGTGRRS